MSKDRIFNVSFSKNLETNEYVTNVKREDIKSYNTLIETEMGKENSLLHHIEEVKEVLGGLAEQYYKKH